MKKGFCCPNCGNFDAAKLLLTTLKGKSISVLMASLATILKLAKQICCLNCKFCGPADNFRMKRAS